MKFEETCFQYNEAELEKLNARLVSFELNNVLEGFQKNYFHIGMSEEGNLNDYMLMYVGNHNNVIKGYTLHSGRKHKERDTNTYQFSRLIEDEFPNLNSLKVFNNFQNMLRSVYERFGIVCTSENISYVDSPATLLLINKTGTDQLLHLDIGKFYRRFFDSATYPLNKKGIQKVYLMYDYKDDKVKFGETNATLETRKKGVAEPTLRASDQEIIVLAAWEAPKTAESDLKKRFHEKHVRGEWYDLRSIDIKAIGEKMRPYKRIENKDEQLLKS